MSHPAFSDSHSKQIIRYIITSQDPYGHTGVSHTWGTQKIDGLFHGISQPNMDENGGVPL